MTKETILKINVTNWAEKLDEILSREEIDFETQQLIVKYLMLDVGLNSPEAGEIAIVAKERGLIKDDSIWPQHKTVLRRGGGSLMRVYGARIEMEKEINGKMHKVREIVGTDHLIDVTQAKNVNNDSEELENSQPINVTQQNNANWFYTDSDKGRQAAINYLEVSVIGHIRERLVQLAGHEDLKKIARRLKKDIDDIVKELS